MKFKFLQIFIVIASIFVHQSQTAVIRNDFKDIESFQHCIFEYLHSINIVQYTAPDNHPENCTKFQLDLRESIKNMYRVIEINLEDALGDVDEASCLIDVFKITHFMEYNVVATAAVQLTPDAFENLQHILEISKNIFIYATIKCLVSEDMIFDIFTDLSAKIAVNDEEFLCIQEDVLTRQLINSNEIFIYDVNEYLNDKFMTKSIVKFADTHAVDTNNDFNEVLNYNINNEITTASEVDFVNEARQVERKFESNDESHDGNEENLDFDKFEGKDRQSDGNELKNDSFEMNDDKSDEKSSESELRTETSIENNHDYSDFNSSTQKSDKIESDENNKQTSAKYVDEITTFDNIYKSSTENSFESASTNKNERILNEINEQTTLSNNDLLNYTDFALNLEEKSIQSDELTTFSIESTTDIYSNSNEQKSIEIEQNFTHHETSNNNSNENDLNINTKEYFDDEMNKSNEIDEKSNQTNENFGLNYANDFISIDSQLTDQAIDENNNTTKINFTTETFSYEKTTTENVETEIQSYDYQEKENHQNILLTITNNIENPSTTSNYDYSLLNNPVTMQSNNFNDNSDESDENSQFLEDYDDDEELNHTTTMDDLYFDQYSMETTVMDENFNYLEESTVNDDMNHEITTVRTVSTMKITQDSKNDYFNDEIKQNDQIEEPAVVDEDLNDKITHESESFKNNHSLEDENLQNDRVIDLTSEEMNVFNDRNIEDVTMTDKNVLSDNNENDYTERFIETNIDDINLDITTQILEETTENHNLLEENHIDSSHEDKTIENPEFSSHNIENPTEATTSIKDNFYDDISTIFTTLNDELSAEITTKSIEIDDYDTTTELTQKSLNVLVKITENLQKIYRKPDSNESDQKSQEIIPNSDENVLTTQKPLKLHKNLSPSTVEILSIDEKIKKLAESLRNQPSELFIDDSRIKRSTSNCPNILASIENRVKKINFNSLDEELNKCLSESIKSEDVDDVLVFIVLKQLGNSDLQANMRNQKLMNIITSFIEKFIDCTDLYGFFEMAGLEV